MKYMFMHNSTTRVNKYLTGVYFRDEYLKIVIEKNLLNTHPIDFINYYGNNDDI